MGLTGVKLVTYERCFADPIPIGYILYNLDINSESKMEGVSYFLKGQPQPVFN